MSQVNPLITASTFPTIPTQFTTDSGVAVPATNNLNIFGGSNISTSGAGDTVTIDAVGLLPLAGGTMTGDLFLNADPTFPLQAATKNYVDTIASGITPLNAVYAASTATLNATYSNGASGVGATLTNAGTLAAFSIDGTSPPLNSTILVKDQSTTFENGIYTLTTVGSGAVAWVLTRATFYDSPSEITAGDLVPVTNGTVNANTSWLETATVSAVGTSPILFTQFTFNPATFLKVANNLSDVASVSTSQTNLGLGTGDSPTFAGLSISGTITSGLWNGSVISEVYGGTNQSSYTLGDTLYSSATNTLSKLPGNNQSVLMVLSQLGDGTISSAPAWIPLPTTSSTIYMFANIASDIGGYYQSVLSSLYVAGSLGSATSSVSTTPVLIVSFATNSGYPSLSNIPPGLFVIHYETKKDTGGQDYYSYAEIYKRSAGGTETLLLTSDDSNTTASNSTQQITVTAYNPSNIPVLSTDRIVIKIYAVLLSGTHNVTVSWDDSTNARFEMPISSSSTTINATAPLTANGLSGTPQAGAVTVALSTPVSGQYGGTGVANTGLTINLGSGAVGKYLASDVSGNGTWGTISGGDITGSALTKVDDTNVTLTLGGTPATALLRAASITAGWIGTLSGARGGTGVANTGLTINLSSGAVGKYLASDVSGNATWATLSSAAVTSISATAPITASASTGAVTIGITTPLALNYGGTNANLTASNGGIFYSTATAGAILSGTATAGQHLQSGASSAPSWTTATYPSTATGTGTILRADGTNWTATTTTYPNTNAINTIMYASSANVLGSIAASNNGVLISGTTGVPSWLAAGTTGQVLVATTSNPASWGTLSGIAVTTLTGTANQVLVNGTSGSATSGAITVTTPQDIGTSSNVRFGGLSIGGSLAETVDFYAGFSAVRYPSPTTVSNGIELQFSKIGDSALVLTNTFTAGRQYLVSSYTDGSNGAFRIYDWTASAELMRFSSGALMGVGTASPLGVLSVAGAMSSSTGSGFARSLYVNGSTLTASASSATLVAGQFSGMTFAKGAFTSLTASMVDIYCNDSTNSGAGTIANAYGFRIVNTFAMAATNKFSFYNASTDETYFAGHVGIGYNTQAPFNKVDLSGNIAIGTYAGTSAPSNGMIVSGQVGFGTSSPDAASIFNVAGTQTAKSGVNQYNTMLSPVLNPTGGSTTSDALYIAASFISPSAQTITGAASIHISPTYSSNVATITNAYGILVSAGTTATGTLTNNYSGYFTAPTAGGTIKQALYTDDLSIGYPTNTAFSNGAIISGKVSIGAAASTSKFQVTTAGSTIGDYGMVTFQDTSARGMSFGFDTTNNWGWIYCREVNINSRALNINNTAYIYSGNVALLSSGSFGGASGAIAIANRSGAPTSNPTGGGILYAESGAGKWRGSGGTTTTFGPAEPHCPVCGSDFGFEWDNPIYGGTLQFCAKCLADDIEQLLGKKKYIRRFKKR